VSECQLGPKSTTLWWQYEGDETSWYRIHTEVLIKGTTKRSKDKRDSPRKSYRKEMDKGWASCLFLCSSNHSLIHQCLVIHTGQTEPRTANPELSFQRMCGSLCNLPPPPPKKGAGGGGLFCFIQIHKVTVPVVPNSYIFYICHQTLKTECLN
jgi:hypothetical protein